MNRIGNNGVAALLVVGLAAVAGGRAEAQTPSLAAALSAVAQERLGSVVAAAEQMAEADYAFRPSPGTRTFGEIIAHVADTNRAFCSAVAGSREPIGFEIEKTVHAKAEIVGHLKASIERCQKALEGLSDARLPAPSAFGGGALIDGTKIPVRQLPSGLLVALLITHTEREYGKLTIYLRLKGLVPPTSQPQTR